MKKITFTLLVAISSVFALCASSDSERNIGLDSLIRSYTATNDSVIQAEVKYNSGQVVANPVQQSENSTTFEQVLNVLNSSFTICSIVIAVISLYVAIKSLRVAFRSLYIATQSLRYDKANYEETKRTADNVMRASFNVQKGQFDDLIRHLYRNLVCTLAFTQKILKGSDNRKFENAIEGLLLIREKTGYREYPSEEHLMKLKVLPEDVLHLENYNHDYAIYKEMHELKLQLRNYDIEVDMAMAYLKDDTQDKDIIMSKLDALTFKPLFLISNIVKIVILLDEKEAKKKDSQLDDKNKNEYQNAASIMTHSHIQNLIDNKDSFKKNEYLDLNALLRIKETEDAAEVNKEIVEIPYNGLGRSYNRFFKSIIDAANKKVPENQGNEDPAGSANGTKEGPKDYVEYSKRFDDKKNEYEKYLNAIEEICGKDKAKPNGISPTDRLSNFKTRIVDKSNFPFKQNFLTMLSIDVTIELSKINMIDIK